MDKEDLALYNLVIAFYGSYITIKSNQTKSKAFFVFMCIRA